MGEITVKQIVEGTDAEITIGITIIKMTTIIIIGATILQHPGITHTLNIHNIIVMVIVTPNNGIKNIMIL